MPSLKMKTKSAKGSLREKHGLHVCQKSSIISKNSLSCIVLSQEVADLENCVPNSWDFPLYNKIFSQESEETESKYLESLSAENVQIQEAVGPLADIAMESASCTCPANLDTIFSPIIAPIEGNNEENFPDGGGDKDLETLPWQMENAKNNSLSGNETCDVSDFFVSETINCSVPLESNLVNGRTTESTCSADYYCDESSIFLDVNECMFLPFLEDTVDSGCQDKKTCEETYTMLPTDDSSFCLAIHQLNSSNQQVEFNAHPELDQADCFDPHMFIRNFPELPDNYLPDLPDMASLFQPTLLPKDSRKSKVITLVLDLDETLVHSTLDHCDDADFSFPVFFNMREHIVYVKQRPHLYTFLERVAEMFEIVVFTASQSIYAKQLLDILDPNGKLISRRAYRESCIFSDGSYTKDLTVLGVDLAKVVIIDNSPQVFQLQVNNGIPIKSWFDDPSDSALVSLLPFLETLVDVDDVRPLIAERFGNKE